MSINNDVIIIDLGHSIIESKKNDVVQIHCSDDFIYDLDVIKEMHHNLSLLSQRRGEKLCVLSLAKSYTNVSSAAIKYVSKGPHKNFIEAEAFLIESLPQRIMANFYIKMAKPIVHANYFTDKSLALTWLRGHIKNVQKTELQLAEA
ncbi:MAG: hypothetical protein ACRCYO_16590 [Bacteroidia bacterium]